MSVFMETDFFLFLEVETEWKFWLERTKENRALLITSFRRGTGLWLKASTAIIELSAKRGEDFTLRFIFVSVSL